MIADIPRTMSQAYMIQIIKGLSSYLIFRLCPLMRKRYPRGHFWNEGYFCEGCGSDFEPKLRELGAVFYRESEYDLSTLNKNDVYFATAGGAAGSDIAKYRGETGRPGHIGILRGSDYAPGINPWFDNASPNHKSSYTNTVGVWIFPGQKPPPKIKKYT